MKRSFENTSDIKNELRKMIPETAIEYGIDPDIIFTMPGKEMLDIPVFKSYFPDAQIIGVESNPKDFAIIQKKAKGKLAIKHQTVLDYTKESAKGLHHGIVFLDYLGGLNNKKLNDIKSFVRNKNLIHPDQKTVLAITFQKGDRQGSEESEDLIASIREDDELGNNIGNVSSVVWLALSDIRRNVRLVYEMEYKNHSKASAMYYMLFVIDR